MFNVGSGSFQRILIVAGIVMLSYGAWQRYELQQQLPSAAEIQLQVERQYALELAESARAQGFIQNSSQETPDRRKLHKQAILRDIRARQTYQMGQAEKFIFIGGALLFVMVISPLLGNLVARLVTGRKPDEE